MNSVRKVFYKYGGVKLVKQYARAGVLIFAVIMAPLLGFSQKGLELLRLAVQYKTYVKLQKRYEKEMKKYDKSVHWEQLKQQQSKIVWICWLQGMNEAPLVVKRCYESVRRNLSDREVILLTAENIFDYVSFPEHIIKKWREGIITNTHFSDLLRLELLIRHGGTWLDATVLCTGGDIPKYILDSDLFFYQVLKPGRDGHCINMSSWLMTACTNNKVLMTVRYLIYKYWEKNTKMVDYFLLHMFVEMVCNYYVEEYKNIVKSSNAIPHILLLDFFEQYDEKKYEEIKCMTAFHKLAYKRDEKDMKKEGTYFDVIINQGRY